MILKVLETIFIRQNQNLQYLNRLGRSIYTQDYRALYLAMEFYLLNYTMGNLGVGSSVHKNIL